MNKLLPKALLSSALLLPGLASQAQVSFGPRVGLNASNLSYKLSYSGPTEPDSKILFGPQIGLALNAQFGNLALQPAVLFTMKGDKQEETGSMSGVTYKSEETLRLNYAEIPVNLVYSTNGADGGFQVFAGPYAAFGLSGKLKSKVSATYNGRTEEDSDEMDVEFTDTDGNENKAYVRGLDVGLNFGLGYKVGGVQAQLGYGLGLGNLLTDDPSGNSPDSKIRNRSIQLGLTYFFE
jgi:hypothetical protein